MDKHNRVSNLQVAFVDIEKYSRRRSLTQIEVIDAFTTCFRNALNETAKHYIEYAQNNDVNFRDDIIALPTGDGAAVIFSFDGLHDPHLYFAKMLLCESYKLRQGISCEKFSQEGWCNCHSYFNLRIGLSEGKGIIYHDVNGGYNMAGGVINLASRVLGLVDSNQIAFTEDAYRHIIDMVDDPYFIEHFVEYSDIQIKHGLKINIYQFIDEDLEYLNSDPPCDLVLRKKTDDVMKTLKASGFPVPDLNTPDTMSREAQIQFMENFANLAIQLCDSVAAIGQFSKPAIQEAEVIDAPKD
jgi:class 3 adenylate cyclase